MPQDVLLFTRDMAKAVAEIEAAGGRVTHQFTEKVLVAEMPDGADASALKQSKTNPPRSLDKASQLAAAAWQAKEAKSRSRASLPGWGLKWDAPGFLPPDPPREPETPRKGGAKKKALSRSTGTPTSLYMEGKIAVGIVIVSGTTPETVMSPAEQTQTVQEVQEGLNFLATTEPRAGLSFLYDLRPVTVSVTPGPYFKIAGNWTGFPPAFAAGVDAGVDWNNGWAYFLKGNQYIGYDIAADAVGEDYPRPIAGNWPGFPVSFAAGVDAGVVWNNGKAYFFKGSQYIRYDVATDRVDLGPLPIAGNWPGFPAAFASGIDAAELWGGKAYFFRGNQYISYDVATNKVDAGFPKACNSTNWAKVSPHFTSGINEVVRWPNGKVYFFKGGLYSTFDIEKNEFERTEANTEPQWRDAALKKMGYPPGEAGSAQYVQTLRENKGAQWAYVAYFTKYPLYHYAYAINERVVMDYRNTTRGPEQINAVFAHETCHIFGAGDEYGDCTCGSQHGHYNVPNYNCENCSAPGIPCLMKDVDLQMCTWTRGQIGWNYGLDKIDAALYWNNGKGYFFDARRYSRFDDATGTTDFGFPLDIAGNWPGFPETFAAGVDAAVVRPVNNKVYFFKGAQYIRFNIDTNKVEAGPASILNNWPGLTKWKH